MPVTQFPHIGGLALNLVQPLHALLEQRIFKHFRIIFASVTLFGVGAACSSRSFDCPANEHLDDASLVRRESVALLAQMREAAAERRAERRNLGTNQSTLFHAIPISLTIRSNVANVRVSAPVRKFDLIFIQPWFLIYGQTHPGRPCVLMHVAWDHGSVDQDYTLSEF